MNEISDRELPPFKGEQKQPPTKVSKSKAREGRTRKPKKQGR